MAVLIASLKTPLYKGEVICVWLLVPVIAGVLVGAYTGKDVSDPMCSITLGILFLNILMLVLYRSIRLYLRRWIAGALVFLFLFVFALWITINKKDHLKRDYFAATKGKALLVVVASEPRDTAGILRFEARVDKIYRKGKLERSLGKILVALKLDSVQNTSFKYGDCLLIPYKFSEVDPPFNPYEFDYKSYLANQGIRYQTFLNSTQVKPVAENKGNPITAYALKLRKKLVRSFERYIPDKEAAALVSTLILGYKAELGQDIISAYSKTGTMHVLSVSGMHVLLVFSILQFLLGFLDKKRGLRVLKVILILSLIWFYSLLTGFSSAVCRAALMCTVYVIGVSFRKRRNSYNTLAASALLLLIVNPYFLFDAGFQLSYLAVLGLVYLHPKIYHLLFVKNKVLDAVWNCASVSIAAQIATVPLSLYYFHQFPLYFLISNLLIALPVAVLMYAGIFFLISVQFAGFMPDIILNYGGLFLSSLIAGLNKSLFYIENLSYSSVQFFPYSGWFYFCLFLAMLAFIMAVQHRNKRMLFFSLGLAAVLTIHSSLLRLQIQNQRQLIFYSLRKNRALSIIDKNKAYVLTNLNRAEKTFMFSVKPSLDALSSEFHLLGSPDFRGPVLLKGNFLGYKDYKVLLLDPDFLKRQFSRIPQVDIVLLTDSPKLKLADLKQRVKFSMLVADGTNRDYRLQQWEKEAQQFRLRFYSLKKRQHLCINIESLQE